MPIRERERFIIVEDDWCPCYEGNKVKLRLTMFPYDKKFYVKLAAWGADDTTYEMEFEYYNFEPAYCQYNFLSTFFDAIPDGITKQWFIDRGFTRF